MRYEGSMHISGFINVVIDEPGITLEEAKALAEGNPEKYMRRDVESIVCNGWETELEKTEDDNWREEHEEE